MSRLTVVKFVVPGMLAIALVFGIFLPSAVLADGFDNGPKVSVEQLGSRPGYQGNPWDRAQPSCSSNRYYNNYPQNRPNNTPYMYNTRPTYAQPRFVQHPNYAQPRYPMQPPQYANNRYDNRYDRYDRCDGSYYAVRRGDTLSSIARYYGISYQELARANGLRSPNRIYAGQRLMIPGAYCR